MMSEIRLSGVRQGSNEGVGDVYNMESIPYGSKKTKYCKKKYNLRVSVGWLLACLVAWVCPITSLMRKKKHKASLCIMTTFTKMIKHKCFMRK